MARSRALRRHHRERKIEWARKTFEEGYYSGPNRDKRLRQRATTPQMCSWGCCGNQRQVEDRHKMSDMRRFITDDFPEEDEIDIPRYGYRSFYEDQ